MDNASSFRIPIYATQDIRRFDIPSEVQPLMIKVNPIKYFTDRGYAFHADLINYNVDTVALENLVQRGLLQAICWPLGNLPKTWLYRSNTIFARATLSERADQVVFELKKVREYGEHFVNITSISNGILQAKARPQMMMRGTSRAQVHEIPQLTVEEKAEVLAGIIYARELGKLEEVVNVKFRFMRPPLYFDPSDFQARQMITLQEIENSRERAF